MFFKGCVIVGEGIGKWVFWYFVGRGENEYCRILGDIDIYIYFLM